MKLIVVTLLVVVAILSYCHAVLVMSDVGASLLILMLHTAVTLLAVLIGMIGGAIERGRKLPVLGDPDEAIRELRESGLNAWDEVPPPSERQGASRRFLNAPRDSENGVNGHRHGNQSRGPGRF